MQIPYTDFHPNWAISVKSKERYKITPFFTTPTVTRRTVAQYSCVDISCPEY